MENNMLIWATNDTDNIPNKVRTRIISVFKAGLGGKAPNGFSGRQPIPDRIRAVAVIFRNNRYDLYPFTGGNTAEAFKVIKNIGRNGCDVDNDFHTEGFPIYRKEDGYLEPWLHEMMSVGLIDAYIYSDRLNPAPMIYRHRHNGFVLTDSSVYRFYVSSGTRFIPVETWEREERGLFDLSNCFYEFEPGSLIRVSDVGVHLPSAKKVLRRYVVSWLRRKSREI